MTPETIYRRGALIMAVLYVALLIHDLIKFN